MAAGVDDAFADCRFVGSMTEIAAAQWDALTGHQPFLKHAFFLALEATGCIGADTGWTPLYALLYRGGVLAAAMPLFLKQHSYGEYVFDWAWADAYQRAGLRYYPKLLSAIPFTPVGGSRLLARHADDRRQLLQGVLQFARETGISGLHCLFPATEDARVMEEAGLLCRRGVQFHWRNAGYRDMDDFLDSLNRDKRKKIRQERRRVGEAGVAIVRKTGAQISDADWVFFERCYRHTYREHRSSPYLNLAFFRAFGQQFADCCVLILAYRDGKPLAAALDIADCAATAGDTSERRIYGRYWGALEYVPNLHFELCYYQGIAHAIEHGYDVFEGGAQGEHKLARGLLPVATESWHWLSDPRFADAIERYLEREGENITAYLGELEAHAPFRDAVSMS